MAYQPRESAGVVAVMSLGMNDLKFGLYTSCSNKNICMLQIKSSYFLSGMSVEMTFSLSEWNLSYFLSLKKKNQSSPKKPGSLLKIKPGSGLV